MMCVMIVFITYSVVSMYSVLYSVIVYSQACLAYSKYLDPQRAQKDVEKKLFTPLLC